MSKLPPFDWSMVDWAISTTEIAATSGRSVQYVSRKRRQLAPETVQITHTPGRSIIDWDSQPLGRETDAQIAARLGVAVSQVTLARQRRRIPTAQRKKCGACGAWFVRRRHADGHLERSGKWQARRYCGHACANDANRGARWRVSEAKRLAAVQAFAEYAEKRHGVRRRVAVVEAKGLTAARKEALRKEHAKMLALAADAAVALMRWAVWTVRTKEADHG